MDTLFFIMLIKLRVCIKNMIDLHIQSNLSMFNLFKEENFNLMIHLLDEIKNNFIYHQ